MSTTDEGFSNQGGFSIPQAFLTQLGEFTTGYLLISINEHGEVNVDESYDSPIIEMGVLNFAKMRVNAVQQSMQNFIEMDHEASMEFNPPLVSVVDTTRDEEDDDDDDEDDEEFPGEGDEDDED